MTWLKNILTGIDNETYDNGRVLCFTSYIIYYMMALGNIFIDKPWSAMDFAGGVGTIAISFGINLHLKRHTEPTGPKDKMDDK